MYRHRNKISRIAIILVLFFVCYVGVSYYHLSKTLPAGIDFQGPVHRVPAAEISFLRDLTSVDEHGQRLYDQEIFSAIFTMIGQAKRYILVDMFLFNGDLGQEKACYRPLSTELVEALLDKKKEIPAISIDVISDPINSVYGGASAEQLDSLRAAGIHVIVTDLSLLRDSNFLYSAFWRIFLQWFGNSKNGGWLRHPFAVAGQPVTLRSYLALLNFKANHRKLCLADRPAGGMTAVITSANPHDASSAHSNVALQVSGDVCRDIYRSEAAVAAFSGSFLSPEPFDTLSANAVNDDQAVDVQLLTERRIKNACQRLIMAARPGDAVYMAMFYLAERDVVRALIQAARRGVMVKLVLDPNKDAFGYRKNGIPNRLVAHELRQKTRDAIEVRWYATHGEQFHPKMIVRVSVDGQQEVILGSANLTRRNIDNFNLETDLYISGSRSLPIMVEIADYIDLIWHNRDGHCYTVDYELYAEKSFWKTWQYRLQESLGLGTF